MTGKFRYYLIEYFNGDIIITDDDFIQEYDRHIMERFEFEISCTYVLVRFSKGREN